MTQPDTDWDAAYRQAAPPPWSIGRPQPELERLIDEGKFRSDVLDSGCGHAALSPSRSPRRPPAQGLTTATFARADVTDFADYPPGSEGRFATIVDSGLFHALPPQRRQDYLRSIFRAAAPGAALYILAFAAGALAPAHPDRPGPQGFTETELREAVSVLWHIDDLHAARVYGNDDSAGAPDSPLAHLEHDGEGHFMAPGFLVSAHKPD